MIVIRHFMQIVENAQQSRYRFVTTCVDTHLNGPRGEAIHDMKRARHGIIDFDDIMRLIGPAELMKAGLDPETLADDWAVSWEQSVWRGIPCIYIVQSGIEHIFTPNGERPGTPWSDDEVIDESIDDDDDFDRDDPEQLQQAVERTIAQVKAYAKRLGVRAEFREQPFGVRSEIELTDLYARQPGKGAGTKIMTLLGKLCDQHGLNLYAKPESPRNVEFYGRFGFKRSQRHFGMLVRYPPLDLDE